MKMQKCLAYWGILYSERWTSPILGIVNPGKAWIGPQDLLRLLLLTHPVMHLVTLPFMDMECIIIFIAIAICHTHPPAAAGRAGEA